MSELQGAVVDGRGAGVVIDVRAREDQEAAAVLGQVTVAFDGAGGRAVVDRQGRIGQGDAAVADQLVDE